MSCLSIVNKHTALTNVVRAAKAHPCSLSGGGGNLTQQAQPFGYTHRCHRLPD